MLNFDSRDARNTSFPPTHSVATSHHHRHPQPSTTNHLPNVCSYGIPGVPAAPEPPTTSHFDRIYPDDLRLLSPPFSAIPQLLLLCSFFYVLLNLGVWKYLGVTTQHTNTRKRVRIWGAGGHHRRPCGSDRYNRHLPRPGPSSGAHMPDYLQQGP